MIGRLAHLLRMQAPVVDNRGLLYLSGATVPTDDTDGFQTGCIFQHTDGGDDTALYVNEGSVTACDFNPVTVGAAGEMSQIEFNDDLTGPLISIDTTDPTGASYETPFLITGTYSSSCALALMLSTTNKRPVSFLFDDGGYALAAGDYRATLSRVLICTAQTNAITLNALRGQIKVLDGIALNVAGNVVSPITGYLELAGTTARSLNGHVACVRAALEEGASGTTTVGNVLAGFEATLNSTRTYAGSGVTAAFVANISSGTSEWQYGTYLGLSAADVGHGCSDAYVGMFIRTGTYASAASKGITLSATNQRPVSFLYDDGGAVLGSGNYRAVLSRVYLASTQTGQVAIRAIRGQVKAADGLALNIATNEMNAINGVEGYIELAGGTGRAVGANTRIAALHALLEIRQSITLTTGGKVVGILAELAQTTAKTVDDVGTAGILVDRVDADHADVQAAWGTGFVIASGAATTGINIGTCTTGIILGGGAIATGISITATSLTDGIKISGTTPVDGVEVSSVCSGAALHVSGTSVSGLLVSGACTTAAINITAANLNCIKSVFNVGAQLGQYVQGIKMEHTRSADIQPSTGGWWGAQIVLNAGTGYTALDKTAYVLHCVFKGDATNPSAQTVNVARFETQSNGKVKDLLFVSANSGSTVEGDVAKFVAHVAPTRAILAVQNGTTGSTPMGICVDIDETMTTGIQFNTGAAITNLLQITAAANTSYFLIADAEAGCLPNYSSAGSAIANLKVKIGSTDGYIKIYDAA